MLNADARDTSLVRELTQAGCQVHLVPTTSKGLYMHELSGAATVSRCQIAAQYLSGMPLTVCAM